MILYRPIGMKEFELIKNSNYKAYPPRLFHQPIFYPVLNEGYASEIAEKWNTKDKVSDYIGIVTKFTIDDEYVKQFNIEVVGNSTHKEMWIPADQLEEFNEHIIGTIDVINTFYGKSYIGKKIEELI